jgi:hypothetical protein
LYAQTRQRKPFVFNADNFQLLIRIHVFTKQAGRDKPLPYLSSSRANCVTSAPNCPKDECVADEAFVCEPRFCRSEFELPERLL